MPKGPANPYAAVLLAIGCLVFSVWAIAVIVQIISPSHPVPQAVNVVTPIVAGGLFGSSILSSVLSGRKRNGNGGT